jgi:peroxiredoxin
MKVRPRAWLPLAGCLMCVISAAPRPVHQVPGSSSPSSAGVEPAAFDPLPSHALPVETTSDEELDRLMATLDALLTGHDAPARRAYDVDFYYRDFVERLQQGQLTPQQEGRVLTRLDDYARRYPTDVEAITRERKVVSSLAIGKVAPEIVAPDLDGVAFKLSDYRGKVVVVFFSGEWCGSCRAEYPYYRLLEDVYRDRPFAILGVSSDKDAATAKQAKIDRGLAFRTWFDGRHGGAIADSWGVAAWPTVYVLDQDGVVRFVNLRQEDLLKGVKQLMAEKKR